MDRRFGSLACAALFAAALAACSGGSGGGSTFNPPGGGGTSGPDGVGPMTIGVALPDGTIGVVNDPHFGLLGGFTQSVYSQALAFPPGTKVTVTNLSSGTPHTLNVLSTSSFPVNPVLDSSPSGSSSLDAKFRSGVIQPGKSISVTLNTPGTYFIGCAFHYPDANSMRDVLQVSSRAVPGPQATPQPGGGPGGCKGNYC